MLSIPAASIQLCLTMKQIEMQKQFIESPINMIDCENARDSWSKTLYERLFDWLVKKLNITIAPRDIGASAAIGLLDIYGFEVFDKNGFEQIMINYTNEKLHQLYISYVFKEEREVFAREGLEEFCGKIKYTDNGMVMELLDKKKTGVFEILDESCVIKTSDDL
jgi:myosin-5